MKWQIPAVLLISIPLMLVAMGWLVWHWPKDGLPAMDIFKMLFGFALLMLISGLAITSFMLTEDIKNDQEITQILTILSGLGGAFVNWAFTNNHKPPGGEGK